MKTYIQTGENITLAAPYTVTAGGGALVGAIFGVAQDAAASGADVVLITEGVFEMPKATGNAWTLGQKLYWDNTAKNITGTVGSNTLVGAAMIAAASGDTVGTVYLDGTIR